MPVYFSQCWSICIALSHIDFQIQVMFFPSDNEWKTRYENQTELNQQLQKQILVLQDKVDEATKTYKESKSTKGIGTLSISDRDKMDAILQAISNSFS